MRVKITWNHSGDGPPVKFLLERRTSVNGWARIGEVKWERGRTVYEFEDRIEGVAAEYRVAAENRAGVSEWENSDTLYMAPDVCTGINVRVL